jgi:alkanesulfonate monooxygenase SsuD/methylene tetrahydromethanopterin reductase-like flavin-dependent oxidoreductase (luciferase family)
LLHEQLAVITGLWSQDPFSFDGSHYTLRDAHFTPKLPRPPTLIVGGSAKAERLPRLAAQYADEYVITLPSVDQCAAIRGRLDDSASRYNRRVRLGVFTPVCVGETEQEVRDRYTFLAETEPQSRRMMNNETAWIMGTPEQAQAQIAALEQAGVDRLLLSVSCDVHRQMLPLLSGTPARRG